VEAATRIQELNRSRGRIRILGASSSNPAQIDGGDPVVAPKTVYVAPGIHQVVIAPASPSQRKLELRISAGELTTVDVTPPAVGAPSARVAPSSPPPVAAPADNKPFPAWVLAVAGGATVTSLLFPILSYRRARNIANEYDDATYARRRELWDDYEAAKSLYEGSWAVPAVLAAATGGLTWWYLRGTQTRVGVQWHAGPNVARIGVNGTF
jgi:hypothetical protein